MRRHIASENTARVLGLALAFFGGLGALGFANGVFAKLEPEALAALAAFAIGFALLTYRLDPGVRALVNRAFAARARKSPAKSPGGSPAAT